MGDHLHGEFLVDLYSVRW